MTGPAQLPHGLDLDRERVLLAFLLPHRGHDGLPGASDGSCIRCNAERALDRMMGRLDVAERALLEYGVHKIRCSVTEDIGRGGDGEVRCTCGFTEASDRAALAAAAPGETTEPQ